MIKFPQGRASERVVSDILAVVSALDRDMGPILSPPVDAEFASRFTEPFVPDTLLSGAELEQSLQPGDEEISQPDGLGDVLGTVSRGDNLLEVL